MSRQRPPWVDELLDLAAQEATGRLIVASSIGDRSWLWLRDGHLTGVSAAMRRPLLARRLVAFQVVAAGQVAKALEAVRLEPGQRLLDVLIAQRLAPLRFIDDFLRSSMAEQMSFLLDSGVTDVDFETGRTQRVSPLMLSVHEVVAAGAKVPHRFPDEIAGLLLRAGAKDYPGATTIDRSVLSWCDGSRPPDEVGDACGLTTGEMLHMMIRLQQQKVLDLGAHHLNGRWNEVEWEDAVVLPTVGFGIEAAAPTQYEDVTDAVHEADVHEADVHEADVHEADPPTVMSAPRLMAPPTQPAVDPDWVVGSVPTMPPPHAEPSPAELARIAAELNEILPAIAVVDDPQSHEIQPVAGPKAAVAGTVASRRDAMSLLQSFGETEEAVIESVAQPEPSTPSPQVSHGPSGHWSASLARPRDPMASGDVFRELQSLRDEEPADSGGSVGSVAFQSGSAGLSSKDSRKRRLFGR